MVWRGRLGEVRPVAARCVMVWHVKEWNGRLGRARLVPSSLGLSCCVKAGKARSSMAGLVLSRFVMAGTAVLERDGRYGNEMVVRI